jgi:uncharacterized protein YrrD
VTRTLRAALRMPVITRTTAEELGTVSGVTVDAGAHRFDALYVGGGKRNARFVDWAAIASFGEDAVIIEDAAVVREAAGEREDLVAKDRAPVLDQRVLSSLGDQLGIVDDLGFDPESGVIETIEVGGLRLPGEQLRGVGSYAVVVVLPTD